MKGMEPNVALADSIMADALMLKEDTGLGIVTMVPEFHFNTKLAHILTGWYRLAQKGLAVEEAYAEWKGLAAEFVAGLPVVSRVNSQTGELMDPLRAARAAYPAPETPPRPNLFDTAVAMHACTRRAVGEGRRDYGLDQDHLNLVELAAGQGLLPEEKVQEMTRRCLGSRQTTAEVNREFAITTRAENIARRHPQESFTMIDPTPGKEVGVVSVTGYGGTPCRFPVAFIDRPQERWAVVVEPLEHKSTSVTNMSDAIMRTISAPANGLRKPGQALRFFEIYESRIAEGQFDETRLHNGKPTWTLGYPQKAPQVMEAARRACEVVRENPLPEDNVAVRKVPGLSATLQKMQERHGLTFTSPASSKAGR